jgi:hypothetical protein
MTNPREAAVRVAALKALDDKVHAAYNQARADALAALSPGDRLHAALPDGADIGTVSVVPAKTAAAVADPAALLAWVQTNAPTEVEAVYRVRESYIGALLARCENVDGAAMHAKTGELLPGVRFETGDAYARVSQTAEQLAAFAKAWRADEIRAIDELDAAVASIGLGKDGVVRVLDPDDTELVERVAEALYEAEVHGTDHRPWAVLDEGVSPGMRVRGTYRDSAEAVIEALRQP